MQPTLWTAMAEPNRLHIVELLRDHGPLTIGEISSQLALNQPQTSKHIRVLHEAGLIQIEPVANRRMIQLRPELFLQLDDWLSSFLSIWERRLDRFDAYLLDLQQKKPFESS